MEWGVLAIGFYFFGENEAEGVPYADVCGDARTFSLFHVFDYGAAGLLVGEHGRQRF
jgi:hypothetical protein